MNALLSLGAQLLHLVLMLAAAPLLTGYVRRVKARLSGRLGPPLLQPFHDLIRLSRKQPVMAENASFVFRAAPAARFAAITAAAMLVPSFALGMALAPLADLLVIAGLLAVARCVLALAAMDLGTGFGGLGASRTMTLAVYSAPAFILVVLTLTLLAGTTNLDAVAGLAHDGAFGLRVSSVLALAATAIVALGECDRMPVADASEGPELDMVQGAAGIEYAGRDLALLQGAASLQLLLWLDLIGAVFLPFGLAASEGGPLAWILGLVGWAIKIAVLGAALAAFEVSVGTVGVDRAAQFLGFGGLLALLAAVLLFAATGFA